MARSAGSSANSRCSSDCASTDEKAVSDKSKVMIARVNLQGMRSFKLCEQERIGFARLFIIPEEFDTA